jgi:nucleotide sugar dehydrogenase
MSLVCANAINGDYAVIGVDLPNERGNKIINNLNNGIFPLVAEDPKIEQLYKRALEKGNFFATTDVNSYSYADVIIVDVNLDVDKNSEHSRSLNSYNVDLASFKKAITVIGDHCKEDVLILVETTVPPGTCKEVVMPIIYDCLMKRKFSLNKIKIGHSYERVMPGPNYVDSIQNFYRVYSGINEKSADAVESFLHTIIHTDEYPLTRLDSTNATEMAKVLENSFRAMNIAFMVEWSRFAEEAKINLYEVVDAIRLRPTHANMMYPGIGVGGYCLTKDALLASWARQNLIGKSEPLNQSEIAININDQMPRYAFEFLQKHYPSFSNSKVLLLGVSYRGDVGDTRSSPVEKLYDYLTEAGSVISCHDPYVKFWEEQSLEIEQDLMVHLGNSPDVIIISTGHTEYKSQKTIDAIFTLNPTFIYDTIGLLSNDQINMLQQKHTIKVLGRGDL